MDPGQPTRNGWLSLAEGGSVRHKSCREEEPETATHSLLMISTPESGVRSVQL